MEVAILSTLSTNSEPVLKPKKKKEFTYFTLLLFIVLGFGLQIIAGIGVAIYDEVMGSNMTGILLEGPYALLVDAAFFLGVAVLYRPVRRFLKPMWNVSVLKEGKTYVYIVVGFLIVAAVQYVMLSFLNVESADQQQKDLNQGSFNQTLLSSWIFFISVAVITPIKEELLYRGVLCGFLTKRHHVLVGIFVSALVFGLLHIGFPITATVMGLVFAIIYYRTKSIFPSMILHMLWNGLVSITVFF